MPPDAAAARSIGDDIQACRFGNLPRIYDTLDAICAARGVDEDACVALRCRNTVPSAVAILWLLARDTGFALCTPDQPAPPFCRYDVESDVLESLQIRDNVEWRGSSRSYRGRMYVRTSGSTSDAKTVLFTHEKLWANARNCVERFQLAASDRVAIPVPIGHMYGLGAAFLPAVLAHCAIDIQADSNVIRYLQRESAFEPSTSYLTPGFCYALSRLRQAQRRYRLTVSAGDKTSPDIFRRYEDAHGCLVSLYGSTELGAVAAGSPDDSFERRCHSTGRPMPGVRIASDSTAPDADADASELSFEHPAGGEGYVNELGEIVEDTRFMHGRLNSRDVGRLGDDGCLRISGRSDHLVKRDGRLVAFIDIESALLKNEKVEAAVVLSDGTTPRGAQLTAVCVVHGGDADPRSLRDSVRQHLPSYAVPDRLVLIDQLPRLESGKPDRVALAKYVAAAL